MKFTELVILNLSFIFADRGKLTDLNIIFIVLLELYGEQKNIMTAII